jgi:hypothetical protein
LHQEMDSRVHSNLPSPGKVETARAGCGHESGNEEGRISGPSQFNLTEDFSCLTNFPSRLSFPVVAKNLA